MKKPRVQQELASPTEPTTAAPLAWPVEGGSWIRQPDGSLVREASPPKNPTVKGS